MPPGGLIAGSRRAAPVHGGVQAGARRAGRAAFPAAGVGTRGAAAWRDFERHGQPAGQEADDGGLSPRRARKARDCPLSGYEMFGAPSLFSIGYDEESPRLQRNQGFCVCRQGDLWWHDLHWLVSEVEKRGVRAQMAADYAWAHKAEYLKRAPRSVLQTNWYYGSEFNPAKMEHSEWLLTYDDLEKAGFDQLPGASNHSCATNIGDTVRYCRKHIDPTRLKGFQVSVWRTTTPEHDKRHFAAIDQLADAMVVNG